MTTNASGTRQIIPIKPNKVDAKSQRKINKQLSENRINIFCQKEEKKSEKIRICKNVTLSDTTGKVTIYLYTIDAIN